MTLRSTVPCNGCTACCRKEYVMLFPEDGDDPSLYDHDEVVTPEGTFLILKHKPNGDCTYLGPDGCTIYDRAPVICKAFDCRAYFLGMTRDERRVLQRRNRVKLAIFEAGRKRLASLTPEERREAMLHRSMTTSPGREFLRKVAGLAS